jgi:ketosteroid isomerase-like protein
MEAESYCELDGERILAFVRFSGRGKRSGLDIGQTQAKSAYLFHVRSGQVTRFVTYVDRDRALADVRHAPDAVSAGS